MATFDLDLVNLVVGQGRLEWEDTIRILDIGVVGVASTTATSIATASAAAATTTISTTVIVSILTMHLDRSAWGESKKSKKSKKNFGHRLEGDRSRLESIEY